MAILWRSSVQHITFIVLVILLNNYLIDAVRVTTNIKQRVKGKILFHFFFKFKLLNTFFFTNEP